MEASDANSRQVGGDHYKGAEYQHWDWATDAKLPYLVGVATKYIARWRRSGKGEQDLEKAEHYIQKIMEVNISMAPMSMREVKLFWNFAVSNDLELRDAGICHLLACGEWMEARVGVGMLLAELRNGAE